MANRVIGTTPIAVWREMARSMLGRTERQQVVTTTYPPAPDAYVPSRLNCEVRW
jgi:hypothetical protein